MLKKLYALVAQGKLRFFPSCILAMVAFSLPTQSWAIEKKPSTTSLSIRTEGVGEIKAGDTVKARRDAVEGLLKNALRTQLTAMLSPGQLNDYNGLVEDNVVKRVGNFVKNYSVDDELAEGTSYRVRARVDFNLERLNSELRTHGLLPQEGDKPRLLFFLQQLPAVSNKSSSKTVVPSTPWGWWLEGQPAPAVYVQDLLTNRLTGLSMNVQAWRKVLQQGEALQPSQSNGEGFTAIYSRIKGNSNVVLEDYLKLAELTQANYVVFGSADTDFMRADLQAVRVEDRKFIGRINISQSELQQSGYNDLANGAAGGYRRMEILLYRLAGVVMSDWIERWQIERRVYLKVHPIKDLKTFNELLRAFEGVETVTALREESFQHQTVVLRLGVNKSVDEVTKSLQQLSYFKGRSRFSIKDEKNIEVERQ